MTDLLTKKQTMLVMHGITF